MLSKIMFRKNRTGFTLVELMAVVLIIGVLVAIAIPVYQNSTADAKVKACKANIRTILGSAAQYESATSTTPANVGVLVTDNYLKSLPVCPVAGAPAYVVDEATNITNHFVAGTSIATATTHKTTF